MPKAWVIEVAAVDAQMHVALPGQDINRVFMLLPARRTQHYIEDVVLRLDRMLTLTLEEQIGELNMRPRDQIRQRLESGHTHIVTLAGPLAIHAHKATVYRAANDKDGDWLDWKPDSYDEYRHEPGRNPVLIGRRNFERRHTRRVVFNLNGLFQ